MLKWVLIAPGKIFVQLQKYWKIPISIKKYAVSTH